MKVSDGFLKWSKLFKTAGWVFPHGAKLQIRCRELGLYKLLGTATPRCQNGAWSTKLPSCVPTTLLTNFTGELFMWIMTCERFNVLIEKRLYTVFINGYSCFHVCKLIFRWTNMYWQLTKCISLSFDYQTFFVFININYTKPPIQSS